MFTNVALTDDGDIWWEGMENTPAHATSWKGEDWTPDSDELSSHPNSRYCTPIKQCPILAPEYDDPKGVPIDAILFGGRRKTTIPLVTEARDWTHGTFMGATLSSETTAAATGQVGVVRRDPMAMLPFIGYNAGDYFNHWITVGKEQRRRQAAADLLRQLVPPRRGRRLPVAGLRREQPRAQVGRRAHRGPGRGVETPIGHVPTPESLDIDGPRHDRRGPRGRARGRPEEWKAEIPQITEWFEKFGDKLPAVLWTELDGLQGPARRLTIARHRATPSAPGGVVRRVRHGQPGAPGTCGAYFRA